MIPNAASTRQIDAANPKTSTWLSANAGSGKTRVLIDRVARLLLDGVDPARILCLTYTKAAASEMQNRLFERLGGWAMLEDARLQAELHDLGADKALARDTLSNARRLFARAIETPGGLRIQTIHSFCASLLRRFPLEAGVSPQFTELDDRAGSLMRDAIVEDMANHLAPAAVRDLAMMFTDQDFAKLAAELTRTRDAFVPALGRDDCLSLFEVPKTESIEAILSSVFLGDEARILTALIAALETGSPTDVKDAAKLRLLPITSVDLTLLMGLEDVFLTGADTKEPFSPKFNSFPTKPTAHAMGSLKDELDDLIGRVEQAHWRRVALLAAERAAVLHAFAAVFLPEYSARKLARGALDFDDLIGKAKALLTDQSVAQWVLFRLDGGIDHILVDEAQDTSPDQWRVIELLAQEFTAGQGARDTPRTIFVVGDKKQSIYSFQGADVSAFGHMQRHFTAKLADVGKTLIPLVLEYSFRSSPAILRLVDLTFDERARSGLDGEVKHIAFKDTMPGRIDLWAPIDPAQTSKDTNWEDPVDMISDEHHSTQLARKIASHIKMLIDTGVQIPGKDGPRPVHAGDFLILVRRRSHVFAEVIAACKALGLPIAGRDRLKLGAEMAVRDLASLMSFLATPEDDLALAEVLRSPLLGWTEDQLYRLAQPRKGYLWAALRSVRDDFPETLAILDDLRDQADFLRPFDLIERALTRHNGRARLLQRLGAEAEDGIDELLSQALAYERNDVPSLTGFLGWLQTDDIDVKRQMDSAGQRIRVMTVHGAKGLEAPIVILPDTDDRPAKDGGTVITLGSGHAVWRTATPETPAVLKAAKDMRKRKAEEESLRLLYVAMTRAQCWLIVAAAGKLAFRKKRLEGKRDDRAKPAWYDLIEAGMAAMGASAAGDGGLTYSEGTWPDAVGKSVPSKPDYANLPDWAQSAAAPAPRPDKLLSPSALGGAKVLPGDINGDSDAAKQRGTALHNLLERLPGTDPERWADIAALLLPARTDLPDLMVEARRVLTDPSLARIFASDTLAEVPVTAEIDGQRLLGTIDRLIITPEEITAVDFKSNAVVPLTAADVPDGLICQMRAYAVALRQIYPDRRVETAILWTRTAVLMPLPDL